MKVLEGVALAHDDVHLVPQFSQIKSRSDIDTSVVLKRTDVRLKLPILASPMDSVSGPEMAVGLGKLGGMAILHRYCDIGTQAGWVAEVVKTGVLVGAAVGVSGDALERAEAVVKAGATLVCVDVAHGHSKMMRETLRVLRERFPKLHLMAGNVGSADAAYDLAKWGADSVRVGVGSGSCCSTRMQTGHGYPLFQNLVDITEAASNVGSNFGLLETQIIADGGHRIGGDICKSLGAGAHLVMLGSMLAGTDEAPGEIIERDGKKFKTYRGMASKESQLEWRGFFSSDEGISVEIPYKGSVQAQVETIRRNIIGGMGYSGAENLQLFRYKATFKQVSHASSIEATTHILGVANG